MAFKSIQPAPDGRTVVAQATMYFSFGGHRREGVVSDTTFQAIENRERTSTTRFHAWRGTDKWQRIRPGDLVRFFEDKDMSGRSLVAEVTWVGEIDLSTCDEATLEEWSRAEGWTPEHGRAIGARNGKAVWIRYDMRFAPEPKPRDERQMDMFGS
jgi:hypothetical protein